MAWAVHQGSRMQARKAPLLAYLALSCVIAGCVVPTSESDDDEPRASADGALIDDEAATDEELAEPDDHHDGDEEDLDVESLLRAANLAPDDTVQEAVSRACTTTVVWGLATQLVEEMGCMKPGSMKRIDGISGISLGSAAFPYLQSSAATALINAQKARGVTMTINSGLRTLPQQYLLYRWYLAGRCGIKKAAKPGKSNHESAIAVDLADNASWRTAMKNKGWRWLGASDPVHFDYVGSGSANLSGLSVKAFQRLWNRNFPNDKLVEDGLYGPKTEARLLKSPAGGFPRGASCL